MDPDSKRLRIAVTDGSGRPAHVRGLTQWLARVAPARARGEVAIALVSDGHVRALNRKYRRKDRATDVLSFPAGPNPPPSRSSASRASARRAEPTNYQRRNANHGSHYLGDIVIATGVARRQAKEAGHSYATELRVLALHGLLHLLGYDHDDDADGGRMARLEARLRLAGGLREGLIERGTPAARAR